jgi:hypothetical protein
LQKTYFFMTGYNLTEVSSEEHKQDQCYNNNIIQIHFGFTPHNNQFIYLD